MKEYNFKSYIHFDNPSVIFKGINELRYIQLSNYVFK